MAVIDEIKQRILQLDAGSFQSMCDRYLSRSGYPNIVSLGTQAGTQKTTRGTPDTYFFDTNGKYIEAISYSYHDDYDGSFIKEIYRVSPTILDKYITKILCATKRPHFDDYNDQSLAFFDMENANDI